MQIISKAVNFMIVRSVCERPSTNWYGAQLIQRSSLPTNGRGPMMPAKRLQAAFGAMLRRLA
jgi:hypothetical protein